MDKDKKKQIVDQLLETFRSAGDLALKLRNFYERTNNSWYICKTP